MSLLSPDKLQERVQALSTRYKSVVRRKTELGGELKAKKDELVDLVNEIKSAGYNPKTLVDDRNNAQKDLEELCDVFEAGLTESEKILSEYDGDVK